MEKAPFTLDVVGRTAVAQFGAQLRDRQWTAHGGSIARLIGPEMLIDSLELDLSQTVWGDPLGVLSLWCMLHDILKIAPGCSLQVNLGAPRDRVGNRFLLFLATQGFLRALPKGMRFAWNNKIFESDEIHSLEQALRDVDATLTFQNANCLTAKIFNTSALQGSVHETAEELVAEADEMGFKRWLAGSGRAQDFMVHKFRSIVAETLDNIVEHAYFPRTGFAGLYARIRSGIPEDTKEYDTWRRARDAENEHCPALDRSNCGKQPGWLEVFVCDTGVGLANRADPHSRSPLRNLSSRIFVRSISPQQNREKAGKTTIEGLQHLGFVLGGQREKERGDFVRIYSSGEWLGEHLNWPPVQQAPYENFKEVRNHAPLPGTHLHFAIEPGFLDAADQRAQYPRSFYLPNFDELGEVRRALSRQDYEAPRAPHNLFDLRFSTGNPLPTRGIRIASWINSIDAEIVIIRPPVDYRKSDWISEILQINATAAERIKCLFFVDLLPSTAADLSQILRTERLPSKFTATFDIVVVSIDWACAAFHLDLPRHQFTERIDLAKSYILDDGPVIGLSFVARVLRLRDSELFWAGISSAYLNETVLWPSVGRLGIRNERRIRGYIDVPLLAELPRHTSIAQTALRRTIASFGEIAALSADELVRPLLDESILVLDGARPLQKKGTANQRAVIVGSVLVSGSTVERFPQRTDTLVIGAAHLLWHPDGVAGESSDAGNVVAVLWLGDLAAVETRDTLYERILNSPFIVRGGERAIPLPRFAKPKNKALGESLYGEAPNAAYHRWQRLGLLKLGHWTYGLQHDLLSIKLGDALDFDRAGDRTIITWVSAQMQSWSSEEGGKPTIAIYPRHRITDRLVRLIKAHTSIGSIKFFPLQLLRFSSISPSMVSPVERQRLGRFLRKNFANGGQVIIIDDAVITSRTLDQLRQIVMAIWEVLLVEPNQQVRGDLIFRTIALLDRSGAPVQRQIVEKHVASNRRFWRWDVPLLGREGSCPLCGVLDRWSGIAARLDSANLKERVEHWIDAWSPTDIEAARFDRGLPPKRITIRDTTRFCVEQTSDGESVSHEIEHLTSTSRAAIAAEICRSTTRRDYPLEKARDGHTKDGSLEPQVRIEILASHILLFLEELTYIDRVERLDVLLKLLWKSGPNTSMSTSLAALTTLVDPRVALAMWERCCDLIEADGFPNDDALLAAYALFTTGGGSFPLERKHNAWVIFRMVAVGHSHERRALSRILLVVAYAPTSIHKSFLVRLLLKNPLAPADIIQLLVMLDLLASSFHNLNLDLVALTPLTPASDANEIQSRTDELRKFLIECLPEALRSQTSSSLYQLAVSVCESDADRMATLKSTLAEIRRLLYGSGGIQERYKACLVHEIFTEVEACRLVEPAVSYLMANWPAFLQQKEGSTPLNWLPGDFSGPDIQYAVKGQPTLRRPILVYVDDVIRHAMAEALSNVVHRTHKTGCPWPGGIGVADMWVRIVYGEDPFFVHVEMANAGHLSEYTRATRPRAHLLNLGGDIRTEAQAGWVKTIVKLPTIAGLERERQVA